MNFCKCEIQFDPVYFIFVYWLIVVRKVDFEDGIGLVKLGKAVDEIWVDLGMKNYIYITDIMADINEYN